MAKKVNEALTLCLFEHKGTSFYNSHKNAQGHIEIFKIKLDKGGYSESGKYYGVGASLFAVEIWPYSVQEPYFNTSVRSTILTELVSEIKALYPNMEVNWNPDVSDIDN